MGLATVPQVVERLVILRHGAHLCLALFKEETLLPYVITRIPRICSRRVDIGLVTAELSQFLLALPLRSCWVSTLTTTVEKDVDIAAHYCPYFPRCRCGVKDRVIHRNCDAETPGLSRGGEAPPLLSHSLQSTTSIDSIDAALQLVEYPLHGHQTLGDDSAA